MTSRNTNHIAIKKKLNYNTNGLRQNHNWVFFTEQGTHFHVDTPTKWWRRFLKRNGYKLIRLHDLRHTSATLLIEENGHPKVISGRLGHSKISTTMDIYDRTTDKADKKAGKKTE